MDNAQLYINHNSYQKYQATNFLKEFLPRLCWTKGENVLDIGSGTGDISAKVLLPQLPKDVSLVGVDISSNMTEFANNNFADENVSFVTMDFCTKNIHEYFPAKYFTKIFSFNSLHWLKDQKQMVMNLATLLKPGGELLAVIIPAGDMYKTCRAISEVEEFRQYCQDLDSAIPPVQYSTEDLSKMLTTEGFDVLVCEQRVAPFPYPSLEVAITSFEAINPFIKRMPEHVRKKYLEGVKKVILRPSSSINILQSGEVIFVHDIIVLLARRPR